MTPLAWILGLVLPASGAVGTGGLSRPTPLDMTRVERSGMPNTALAAPAVFDVCDLVTVAAADPAVASGGTTPFGGSGSGSSELIICPRSVYGRSDLGVNRARVQAWLRALDRPLAGA